MYPPRIKNISDFGAVGPAEVFEPSGRELGARGLHPLEASGTPLPLEGGRGWGRGSPAPVELSTLSTGLVRDPKVRILG